jgi:prophage tail gpP-like protein
MSDAVKLVVGGREYAGWTSVSVTRSIESIAGRFRLSLTDRWPGQQSAWPIPPGAECSFSIGGETVLTGLVDMAAPRFDSANHESAVTGRDRTGQMVDCSANHSPGEWSGIRLNRLAAILAKPFGVTVTTATDIGAAFETFKLQPGETAFEALDRACRLRGVLPVADGQGGLVLTSTGKTRCSTALVQGENVKSAALTNDTTDRYRKYIVRGSQPSSDFLDAEQASAVEARATDAGATAGRTLIILAESAVDIASARKRAQWEATVRAARSVTVSVTVQGWRQGNGELWPVNSLVSVDLPYLRVSGDLLISELTHSLDESGGMQTELTLRRKDAFLPEPEKPVAADPWGDVG